MKVNKIVSLLNLQSPWTKMCAADPIAALTAAVPPKIAANGTNH